MTEQERKYLEAAGLSADIIAKTEEVLQVWEIELLLVICAFCDRLCLNPLISKRQYRRKTPPSELFLKLRLGLPDKFDGIICLPCDNARWQ